MPRPRSNNRVPTHERRRAFCDCGQVASVMHGNAYICKRCCDIETFTPAPRSISVARGTLGAPTEFFTCNLRSISSK